MNRTTPINNKPAITVDQQVFVNELLDNKNPLPKVSKYISLPDNITVEELKAQYLKNPVVQSELKKALQDKIQRLKVTSDSVIAQLARFAFVDPAELYDDDGNIKPVKEMRHEVRCCIQSLETQTIFGGERGNRRAIGTVTKIKLNSQLDALKVILEKIILKEQAAQIIQNNLNIVDQSNTYNTYNQDIQNQQINVKELTKEQVKVLLELKGYKPGPLGYQPEVLQMPNTSDTGVLN